MEGAHDHAPEARCEPTCPGWAYGALELFGLRRRYPEMLEACRAAEQIELVVVAPSAPGVELPAYLMQEDHLVRLKLVVGRDTPEVFMDEWGIRCTLTFRGVRHDCALPWHAILGGILKPPARKRPRFGVIDGGKKD